jgi:hypothetical protein
MEKEKIQILLDEFKALREEISRRSKDQLSLIQMNITAIGVILGFVIGYVKDSRVLLIIPLVSSILGIIYLDNAEAIQHIGRFIQRQIKPAMFAIVKQELPDYESYVRRLEVKRADRLLMVGFPVLAVFGLLPTVSILVPFWMGIDFRNQMNDRGIFPYTVPDITFLLIFCLYWLRLAWVSKKIQNI